MKYTRKDLGAYKLHLINTDKFKTIMIRVSFRSPIIKETITMRNILSNMFMQSSKKYNSKRALTIKAQDLYAADLQTSNTRLGNYINTDFYLSVLNDKYTEEGNFKDAIEFLGEIIFNPDVEDEKFDEEKLDIVKTTCRSALESIKENTSNYCLIKMFELFDKDSPCSYRMMGYLEDLDKINTENLYEHYLDMLKSDLVDIFVIGEINEDEVTKLIKENMNINTLKKQKVPYLLEEKDARSKVLSDSEEIEGSQSKLSMAFRVNGLSDYERNYPLSLFNVIFGGSSDSKLFKVVREENSLCYTIRSIPNKLDNLILVRAGIDKASYEKCVSLVKKCLEDISKGDFTDRDLNMAKEYYNTALEELEESEYKIINNYLMTELIGTDTIEEKREKMNKVTKEEIVEVAKKVYLDTIFLLEGVKNEGN